MYISIELVCTEIPKFLDLRDMQQRNMKEFKARFHVNNPNHNKLASGILGSLLLFICL